MANRFVSSTGSDTSPYETWAKAATTLATAITGSVSGDVFAIDAASPPADVGASTVWTFLGDASVIASTNSGTSTITPTTMGASTWLGTASNWTIELAGAYKIFFYGITLRSGGTSATSIIAGRSDGAHYEFENCYLWLSANSTSPRLSFGPVNTTINSYVALKNPTLRFGHVGQGITTAAQLEIVGGSISSAGSAPTSLFKSINYQSGGFIFGMDLSHMGSGTLVESMPNAEARFTFSQCKLGSGAVPLATQTPANKGSGKVWLFDCASGDTHGFFGYYDAFGSVESDTGIYVTAGAAAQSWKVTTTANCSFGTPFVTPWVNLYNTGTSAITPYMEILRDGSATAYTDAQVWGQFSAKTITGSTQPSFADDRQALSAWVAGTTATDQATGTGTGNWTGENATAWSGKVDSGASMTPAENGHIRGRVAVGAASITVYVDPQIRT